MTYCMVSTSRAPGRSSAGFTLVELLVSLTIFAVVAGVLTTVLVSANRTHRQTTNRAELQAASRQALSLLTAELAQAGADTRIPPVGIVGVVAADLASVRVRADLNADGAIQTAEPSEDVTYTYNAEARTLLRNPGSGAAVVLQNVTDLRFTYFDAADQPLSTLPLSATDRALVRSVGITLTSENRDSHPFTHATRITLRNLVN
jgi:prepilin-type N-terminal cleavage/methylation domain-containing protein